MYKRLEEICSVFRAIRQIENHRSWVLSFASVFENHQISALSSTSVSIQEALVAKQIRVENNFAWRQKKALIAYTAIIEIPPMTLLKVYLFSHQFLYTFIQQS